MSFENDLQRLIAGYPELNDLSGASTLSVALRFLEKHSFVLSQLDVVAQDEFSHDVVVPFACGTKHLVFGTTWLGVLTAVAVYDKRPDAETLLQARLSRGWKPQASELVDGPTILGYAQRLRPSCGI